LSLNLGECLDLLLYNSMLTIVILSVNGLWRIRRAELMLDRNRSQGIAFKFNNNLSLSITWKWGSIGKKLRLRKVFSSNLV